ncbi:hypothetical protein O5D80_006725 [Batrachochytrium dendrobatidis]|nr:hypothetical protein O5D80_006725 [Batrachochytrium dendrobatidis]
MSFIATSLFLETAVITPTSFLETTMTTSTVSFETSTSKVEGPKDLKYDSNFYRIADRKMNYFNQPSSDSTPKSTAPSRSRQNPRCSPQALLKKEKLPYSSHSSYIEHLTSIVRSTGMNAIQSQKVAKKRQEYLERATKELDSYQRMQTHGYVKIYSGQKMRLWLKDNFNAAQAAADQYNEVAKTDLAAYKQAKKKLEEAKINPRAFSLSECSTESEPSIDDSRLPLLEIEGPDDECTPSRARIASKVIDPRIVSGSTHSRAPCSNPNGTRRDLQKPKSRELPKRLLDRANSRMPRDTLQIPSLKNSVKADTTETDDGNINSSTNPDSPPLTGNTLHIPVRYASRTLTLDSTEFENSREQHQRVDIETVRRKHANRERGYGPAGGFKSFPSPPQ